MSLKNNFIFKVKIAIISHIEAINLNIEETNYLTSGQKSVMPFL